MSSFFQILVEFDEPVGKNNGTIGGHVYVTPALGENHGALVPPKKVTVLQEKAAEPLATQEGTSKKLTGKGKATANAAKAAKAKENKEKAAAAEQAHNAMASTTQAEGKNDKITRCKTFSEVANLDTTDRIREAHDTPTIEQLDDAEREPSGGSTVEAEVNSSDSEIEI